MAKRGAALVKPMSDEERKAFFAKLEAEYTANPNKAEEDMKEVERLLEEAEKHDPICQGHRAYLDTLDDEKMAQYAREEGFRIR